MTQQTQPAQPRSRRRVLRGVLIGLAALVLVIVAAGAIGWASFDPNAWKPRIAAAVKRATGRDLALNGRLALIPGVTPGISADNVALANIAGGSRPEMATVQRLELRVALLPLLSHRVVIEGLTLVRPDILLERNAAGTPNWIFRPEVPAETRPPATPTAPRTPTRIALRAMRIENGRAAWRDRQGHLAVVEIPHLDATSPSDSAPLHLAGDLAAHGVPIALTADTGPLDALLAGKAAPPWLTKLTLAALGGHLDLAGTPVASAQPGEFALTLDGAMPDLGQLNRLFPHARLPPLHDFALSLKLVKGSSPVPEITALKLHLGAADLSGTVPELRVQSLDLADAAMDQPAQLDFHGTYRTVPVTLAGRFGPAAALSVPAGKPFAVDLDGTVAGATLALKGGVATPRRLAGIDIRLSGKAPDLSALTPIAGRQLPALRDVSFSARLGDRPGGFALSDLALSSAQGDLSGGLEFSGQGGRRSVRADLAAKRLDLDGLQAVLPAPPPAPPPVQPAPPAAGPAAAPVASGPARVIPDTQLPIEALRSDDADLRLTIAALRAGGVDYRDVAAHLVLAGGHLMVAPVSADTPGGAAQGALEIDAAKPSPSVGVMVHAPELALAPLLAALHLPGDAGGTAMLDVDLHGNGTTPRALAATAEGRFGIAMVNGEVDNALITRLFGKVLSSAHLPAELAGHTDVRCFALRLDATHGIAKVSAFTLDTSRLGVTGTGTVDLADEGLALQLRPVLRLGGNGIAVPVRVTGTLAAPQAALDTMSDGRVGAVIGALSGAGQAESCGPALASARNGQPGPAPAAAPAGRDRINPGDLLRLFRHKG